MALLILMRLLEEGFKDCNTKGNASWYEPRPLLDEAHLFHISYIQFCIKLNTLSQYV